MKPVIQNAALLAETPLRADALAIAEAAYAAINTDAALRRKLTLADDSISIEGKQFPIAGRRVYFVGVGKCAIAAAHAIEEVLASISREASCSTSRGRVAKG